MSVKVILSSLLRQKVPNGQDTFQVSAGTPLDCLHELESRFPDMRKWLYDDRGGVRPQIWLFVNGEKIHPDELAHTLADGDEVQIMLALSGG